MLSLTAVMWLAARAGCGPHRVPGRPVGNSSTNITNFTSTSPGRSLIVALHVDVIHCRSTQSGNHLVYDAKAIEMNTTQPGRRRSPPCVATHQLAAFHTVRILFDCAPRRRSQHKSAYGAVDAPLHCFDRTRDCLLL